MVTHAAVLVGHEGIIAGVLSGGHVEGLGTPGEPQPAATLGSVFTALRARTKRRATLRIGLGASHCRVWRAATDAAAPQGASDGHRLCRVHLGTVDDESLQADLQYADWQAVCGEARRAGFRRVDVFPALAIAASGAGSWRDGPWACRAETAGGRWIRFERCAPEEAERPLISASTLVQLLEHGESGAVFRPAPRIGRAARRTGLYLTVSGAAAMTWMIGTSGAAPDVHALDLARAGVAHAWHRHAVARVSHATVLGNIAASLAEDEAMLSYQAESTAVVVELSIRDPEATLQRLAQSRWIDAARLDGPVRTDSTADLVRARIVLALRRLAAVRTAGQR